MKKIFYFKSEKHKPERQLDAIRHEIKKYLARERRKPLPKDAEVWLFDCKFGESLETAQEITEVEIKSMVTEYFEANKEAFYLEILARAGSKPK